MMGRAIRREDLTPADRDAMFDLLGAHFDGIERAGFEADLLEKNWVVVLLDESRQLVGFSTLLQYRTDFRGEHFGVIYSGDTIVDPAHWGSLWLPKVWMQTVRAICAGEQLERILWLLLSSGYRTYRFLPVYWRSFYPRHDLPTPPDVQQLIDRLARERFASHYDPDSGLVRFDQPQRLRGTLASIPAGKLQDAHVAYFARRNPGYAQGDQLVCLTELGSANLTAAGRRLYGAIDGAQSPAL